VVKTSDTNKIMGCIFGTPKKILVGDQSVLFCHSQMMTVHTKLRGKRFAPVLMKELTNRCLKNKINAGYFTTNASVPTPFSSTFNMSKFLNIKKCVEV